MTTSRNGAGAVGRATCVAVTLLIGQVEAADLDSASTVATGPLTCREACEQPIEPCLRACYTDKDLAHTEGAIEKCLITCDQQQRPCYQKCADALPKQQKKKR